MSTSTSISIKRRVKKSYYERSRLIDEIDEQLQCGALWLQAPAGMGKSTLISSYVGQIESELVWYNIDSRDRDLGYFLEKLNQACGKSLVSKNKIGLINKPFGLDNEIFTDSIFETYFLKYTGPRIFVFDNCEQIPSQSPVITALHKLVQYRNPNVKIIFISRADPFAEFSNLIVKGQLVRFSGQALNLTMNEFSEYLAYSGLSVDNEDELYSVTDGWIAGIILIMESIKFNCQIDFYSKQFDYNTLFSYIAKEIYQSSDVDVQTLLVSCCLVNEFSAKEAKTLSQLGNVHDILEKLCNANYFTTKQDKRYKFHPLLVKFLQSILFKKDEEKIDEIYSRTHRLLVKKKEYEKILELNLERKDWMTLEKIILKYSNRLMNQGKIELVRNTITQMPKTIVNNNGWLLYWLGACYQPVSPADAVKYYRLASVEFDRSDDTKGYLLSSCGETECTLFAMDDYRFLYTMVQRIELFKKSKMKYPSVECHARVAANTHAAILFSHPEGESLAYWEKKINIITKLLHVTFQSTNRVLIGMGLYYQKFFQGKVNCARVILNSLKPSHLLGSADAASKIVWHMMNSMQSWIECEYEECAHSCQLGLEIAESTGLMFLAFPTVLQGAYGRLNQGDLKGAEEFIPRLDHYRKKSAKLKNTIIDNYMAELEIKKGNIALALEYSERALELERECGMKVAYANYAVTRAEALIIDRQFKSAASLIEEIREIGDLLGSPMIAFRILWLEAKLAYCQEAQAECLKILTQALAIASNEGFINHLVWIKEDALCFYQLAFDHGIETAYIRRVAEKRSLSLNFGDREVSISKTIQITTLGEFKITINGEELKQSRKTKRKPIELLKYIIASQAEWVSQAEIQDQMWPDSDGDAAAQALYTTLHRLRKLLGGNQVVERREGMLRLVKQYVSVDLDNLDSEMGAIRELLKGANHADIDDETIQSRLTQLVDSYSIEFLPNDCYLTIVLATRRRIASKLNRFISDCR